MNCDTKVRMDEKVGFYEVIPDQIANESWRSVLINTGDIIYSNYFVESGRKLFLLNKIIYLIMHFNSLYSGFLIGSEIFINYYFYQY